MYDYNLAIDWVVKNITSRHLPTMIAMVAELYGKTFEEVEMDILYARQGV